MKKYKKIYIEITNICNKQCSFCIKSNRVKREMSVDEFKYIINEIKSYTDYIYLHVKGEPLLHSKFKEIISICEENNIKVNITTNGTLLYNHLDTIINSHCIRQINISIHSYKKAEDLYEVFNAVDNILSNKEIYIVYRYWTFENSVVAYNNVMLNEINKHYNVDNDVQNKLINDDNIKINDYIFVNKDLQFDWPSINNDYYSPNGYCLGLKSHIAILSNGDVVPCCLDGEGIINLGNIFNIPFEKIINSKKVKEISKGFMNNIRIEELCKHCSFNK